MKNIPKNLTITFLHAPRNHRKTNLSTAPYIKPTKPQIHTPSPNPSPSVTKRVSEWVRERKWRRSGKATSPMENQRREKIGNQGRAWMDRWRRGVTEASSPRLVMATLSLKLGSNLEEFLISRTPTLKTQMRPSLSDDYDNHVFVCLLFLLDHETYEM